VERGVVYRLPQVIPWGRGRGASTCPTKASSSHLSEAVLRQVDLAVSLRGAEGLEVPPLPPAYVRLVSVGWEVEGRRYASPRVERPLVARAVYRATPALRRREGAELCGGYLGYYPAGSVVRIGVKMPEAPPGRLRRVGGAQRDGERGRWRGPYLRRRDPSP
jgi:hypothetical protein